MKTRFFDIRRRPAFWLQVTISCAALLFSPANARATDLIWTNVGVITEPPQIDAENFFNAGTIDIFISGFPLPFETSNTRNFTNSGTMISTPGWIFDNAPNNLGERKVADSFVNLNTGIIQGLDPQSLGFSIGTVGGAVAPSTTWVLATNISNKGLITAGANGWLKLVGTNVDLARGRFGVTPIVAIGAATSAATTNYFPDAGIYDLWWGGTNLASPPGLNSSTIWTPPGIARAPRHQVLRAGNVPGGTMAFNFLATHSDSLVNTNGGIMVSVTNLVGVTNSGPTIPGLKETNIVVSDIFIPTNISLQAAIVSVSDPSRMDVSFDWYPSSSLTNPLYTVGVSILTSSENVLFGTTEINPIYFYDTLAAEEPRQGLLLNVTSGRNVETYTPTNYLISRLPLRGPGLAGLGVPAFNLLYDPTTYSNRLVAADWAGYGVFIDNKPSEPPAVPAVSLTNLAGRVDVYSDVLDMRRARVRGEGAININTKHLVGSAGALVDCENLSFNLSSTNNDLRFVDLSKGVVNRLKGNLYAWSAVWVNQATFLTPNWLVTTNFDTNGTKVLSVDVTSAPLTNSADLLIHVLLLDGDFLQATVPVTVWDLITTSKNVEVDDTMTVVQSFRTDAENFTLNGGILFSNAGFTTTIGTLFSAALNDFGATNAPNILNFTNNGSFTVPSSIHFGDDRPNPYLTFVNEGTINSSSLGINSAYVRNSGAINLTGPLTVKGQDLSFENGISSSTSTHLTADTARLTGYQLTASSLFLNIGTLLSDAGTVGGANTVIVSAGLDWAQRPASSDLRATSLRIDLPSFMFADYSWPGEDRGADAAGYVNNVALGRLLLNRPGNSPFVVFLGTGNKNALYVDNLDLSALGQNFEDYFDIDSSLTIYYASAKLGFTPPPTSNNVPQTPEEYLNGKFGGHLVWVSSYAGIYSSVAVIDANGQTVMMNIGLRNSRIIDSDGDGIPNYFDPTPLGGSTPSSGGGLVVSPSFVTPSSGGKVFSLGFEAAPKTAYDIEVATNLAHPDWQLLSSFTNSLSTAKAISIPDPNAPTSAQRFYRIRIKQ
jgi:hypothetical protein